MDNKLCSVFANQIPYHDIFLNGFVRDAFMELNYAQEAENQMYFREELHSHFGGSTSNKHIVQWQEEIQQQLPNSIPRK